MSIHPTCLLLADISGYTKFVRQPDLSLLHAEQIVSELLESIIDEANHPLQVNKLEGDAALMFARGEKNTATIASNVAQQSERLFAAFRTRQLRLTNGNTCICDACSGIARLRLKIVLHVGDVLHKRVRRFEELAGEPVILIHRLLKNSIQHNEYLLLTEDFRALIGRETGEMWEEACEGFGHQSVHLYHPASSTQESAAEQGVLAALKLGALGLSLRARWNRLFRPRTYYNLIKP